MEEPSVLDYLKAILTPWRGKAPRIPPLDTEKVAEPGPDQAGADYAPDLTPASTAPTEEFMPVSPAKTGIRAVSYPWRSALALLLAFIGQWTLEPTPNRTWIIGVVFYFSAFGFLILANQRGEWALPFYVDADRQTAEQGEVYYKVRRWALVFSLPFLISAFLALKGNLFTPLNLTLWLIAIVLFLLAFWQPGTYRIAWREWWANLRQSKTWQIALSPWMLLVVASIVLVVFFRVYRLNQVPPEMVSDHAEKLLDIWDVLHGQTRIFFPRNTGREAIQMYLTAGIIQWLGTGYSFLSLKIGTILAGLLTLPFIYLIGKEVGNRRAGLLAVIFAGIAYWPNVISRAGLRFPLYPLFAAPAIYFLIRGLRSMRLNNFILSGLFLGIGLQGYTPIRILPFVIVAAVGIFLLHRQSKGVRKQALIGLVVLSLVSFVFFLPLFRYSLENPELFSYRSFTRLGSLEQPLPGPAGQIFLSNLWKAVTMFGWDDGEIWVHSVTHRPALDVISAALFYLGVGLIIIRYVRQRHWLDMFLVLSVPLLLMPSILSLAFPAENPALNRMSGAIVPVFVIIGLALDSWMTGISEHLQQPLDSRLSSPGARLASPRARLAWGAAILLIVISSFQNYDLVFNQYQNYYLRASWNTSEMGQVIRDYADSVGKPDSAWVVAYPYWVDTRLVGINAGYPTKDYAIQPDQLEGTLTETRNKLFLVNPEDKTDLETLTRLYPQGVASTYSSPIEGHSFVIFFVPNEK
jgi:Dolichyl-phosphate-mannose-protein mannosyltransferase